MFFRIIEYPAIMQSFLDKYQLVMNHSLTSDEIRWVKRDIIYTRLYKKFMFYHLGSNTNIKN